MIINCPNCNGTGKVLESKILKDEKGNEYEETTTTSIKCTICGGTGKVEFYVMENK